ncbi:MAG: hypothetical protein IPJ34_19035 [Myxococcales bacterium]|nr:hypothetical protein [Myxococcales bacterium]
MKKNGASYNVLADTWKLIDSTTMPAVLRDTVALITASIWTGGAMVICGGG